MEQRESGNIAGSQTSFLTTVEDLINRAMGPADQSKVDFKLMQKVLYLLARQLRLLDQKVLITAPGGEPAVTSVRTELPKTHERAAETETTKSASEVKPAQVEDAKKLGGVPGPRTSTRDARVLETISAIPASSEGSDESIKEGRPTIDVVTLAEFRFLEAKVKELQSKIGPIPGLKLPENKRLVKDIVQGSASLIDTMEAMKLNARIQAAEQAVERLADLMAQLQPPEKFQVREPQAWPHFIPAGPKSRKSVSIHPTTAMPSRKHQDEHRLSTMMRFYSDDRVSMKSTHSQMMSRMSVSADRSSLKGLPPVDAVTHGDMSIILGDLRNELLKNVDHMTQKSSAAADHAVSNTLELSEKFEQAALLDQRITTLRLMVSDYLDQLGGFDSGIVTQIQNFLEQMVQMRADLQFGMEQMETMNANSEAMAIMELADRIQTIFGEVDNLGSAQARLHSYQKKLTADLKSLIATLESHSEQKVDREEVQDCLRDKANLSQLDGLLKNHEFVEAKETLDNKMEVCYSKFQGQEVVWQQVVKDLRAALETKADLTHLLAERDDMQYELRQLEDRINKVVAIVGEPKAAMVTRKLAKGAVCALCTTPALMEYTDPRSSAPPALPAFKPPLAPDQPQSKPDVVPCRREIKLLEDRRHRCTRYTGGSHTLINARVTREQAASPANDCSPTKKFYALGADGRYYKMEEDLEPCRECNEEPAVHVALDVDPEVVPLLSPPPSTPRSPPEHGAGDLDYTSSTNLGPATVTTDINLAFKI